MTPYKIVVVPLISQEPTKEQMAWMFRQMRVTAEFMRNRGLEGTTVNLLVYPMSPQWGGKLPHWAQAWRRPEHCTIDLLAAPTRIAGNEVLMLASINRMQADEVWCLNAPNHREFSRSPPARLWQTSRADGRVMPHVKLVPSWVMSEEPPKPAEQKEVRNAKPNGNPGPAKAAQIPRRPPQYGGFTTSSSRSKGRRPK